MYPTEQIVNLDLAPSERWKFLAEHKNEVKSLITSYLKDFEGADLIFESMAFYRDAFVSKEYQQEINCIAEISGFSPDKVLTVNLYYDILKLYLGCSAFVVETGEKILHARNLDWWTENNQLSEYSMIFDFRRNGKTVFKSVGWPGFIGVLSGIRPGSFSITLNAVSSSDLFEIAEPVTFLIRDILYSANSYAEALEVLRTKTIPCDCLLLLSGTKAGEKAVIERTPSRSAIRISEGNSIVVTNDYKKLENTTEHASLLQSTSCGRYDRVQELLSDHTPSDFQDCINILQDDSVMMGITVQQMVFDNCSGEITLVKSNANKT